MAQKPMSFTPKQLAALKKLAASTKNPDDRRDAKAWLKMVFQKKLGDDLEHQVKKNPEMGMSQRVFHQRRRGRIFLAGELENKRPALSKRVKEYNELLSGKGRRTK